MKLDIEEIRGQLRKYCLRIGVLLIILLLLCRVSPHHLLSPLVPLFISEVAFTYWRFGDPSRVAKPIGKDNLMALLAIVVALCFTHNFAAEQLKYVLSLFGEIIAAFFALFFFRRLKLDRNPIGENSHLTLKKSFLLLTKYLIYR